MRIRIMSHLLILSGVLILTSCATKKEVVYGTYLMPPKKVTEIKELKFLEIVKPNIDVNAKQVDPALSARLGEEITALLAGCIESQGFYKTADSLWCKNSTDHYSKLNKFFTERNRHGYDSFSDYGQNNKPAKLYTDVKFTVTEEKGIDTVTKRLVTVPYNSKATKEGVPYTVPDPKRTKTTKVTRKIPFIKYKIVGNIDLKILTNTGHKLYEKKSGLIAKTFKIGGEISTDNSEVSQDKGTPKMSLNLSLKDISDGVKNLVGNNPGKKGGRKTIPTMSEMVATVFGEYIREVVKDISPYTETKPLIINEDGDEKAVLLLKAQAYSEALTTLDEVIEKARKDKEEPEVADLYNFAIALEAIGEYSDALAYYQEALKAEPEDQEIITAKNRLMAIYKSKKRLIKNKVRKKNSAYKTKENKQR